MKRRGVNAYCLARLIVSVWKPLVSVLFLSPFRREPAAGVVGQQPAGATSSDVSQRSHRPLSLWAAPRGQLSMAGNWSQASSAQRRTLLVGGVCLSLD